MPGPVTEKSFCSWSGGKDSAMAFYYHMKEKDKPVYLLTMFEEEGRFTRSHHIPREVIRAQAQSLGAVTLWGCASWESYQEEFLRCLSLMKDQGVRFGVFGDIDIEEHRQWVETTCSLLDVTAHLPLWQKPYEELLGEFLDAGFEAYIVGLREDVFDRSFLGRKLDHALLEELQYMEVNIAGENGEFHTVVTDGPIFSSKIHLPAPNPHYHCGYWFQY